MQAHFKKYVLEFKRPAGTSRGVLRVKETYFLYLNNGKKRGVGECNLFKGLSIDDRPDYEEKLQWLCEHISQNPIELYESLKEWPSILFGYEMALKSLQSQDVFTLFPSLFTLGEDIIDINGLVWMGDQEFMLNQLEEKLVSGFNCMKFKIGAIEFDQELAMLDAVRSRFRESEVTIRVDANGAFTPQNAMSKLEALSRYHVHSIEQPIKQGQWQEMALLCEQSPIDIALDEELIGLYEMKDKKACVEAINPQYVILKPALIGGFQSCREWINIAESNNVGWWMTSALESNIGLNAIAQFTYILGSEMPQGLGTGGLYTNNIDSPLEINNGALRCNNISLWDTKNLNL